MSSRLLLSCEDSKALDLEAQNQWCFNVFSLIEAAGRNCAQVFTAAFPELFINHPRVTIASGTGNNGADGMVMLRYWLLSGLTDASNSTLVLKRMPKSGETAPWIDLLRSLEKMKVKIISWENINASPDLDDIFSKSDIIIDGIAGTGLSGPLKDGAAEMAAAINSISKNKSNRPFVVSLDIPSGISDPWEPGMPIIKADITLAVEPQKYCVFTPAARPYAGTILPVTGIFPGDLINSYKGAQLLNWESESKKIPKVKAESYKHERGVVEIHAGSIGATGAAIIASRGAQASGAGLVRLVVDNEIHSIIASSSSGVMVIPTGSGSSDKLMQDSDAILLGPGWGNSQERVKVLENAIISEKNGTAIILDADAIELAKGKTFNGNTILTPHPGEFNRFTGIDKQELLKSPIPILQKYSRLCNAIIVFKSHVIIIAAPDGRLGILDGMFPGLATGGSGDLLSGFCAAIAARMNREKANFDAYNCAAAAAALLIRSGEILKNRFTDPLEVAGIAADLAGCIWLSGKDYE